MTLKQPCCSLAKQTREKRVKRVQFFCWFWSYLFAPLYAQTLQSLFMWQGVLFFVLQRIQVPVWSQKDLVWAQAHWWHGCSGPEVWRRLCLGLQELRWGCAVWLCCTRCEMLPVPHRSRLSGSLLCPSVTSYGMAQEVVLGLRIYISNLWPVMEVSGSQKNSDFAFTRKSIECRLCSCIYLQEWSSY